MATRRRVGRADAPSLDGDVERPGNISRAEDEYAGLVVSDPVHLNEEFGLDASRRFRLAFAARPA